VDSRFPLRKYHIRRLVPRRDFSRVYSYSHLFHRRTRASYVYNGCVAWYNVVLTPRIHSSVKYVRCVSQGQVQVRRPTADDPCDGGISVLYNCLLWCISSLTLTYTTPVSCITYTYRETDKTTLYNLMQSGSSSVLMRLLSSLHFYYFIPVERCDVLRSASLSVCLSADVSHRNECPVIISFRKFSLHVTCGPFIF